MPLCHGGVLANSVHLDLSRRMMVEGRGMQRDATESRAWIARAAAAGMAEAFRQVLADSSEATIHATYDDA